MSYKIFYELSFYTFNVAVDINNLYCQVAEFYLISDVNYPLCCELFFIASINHIMTLQ